MPQAELPLPVSSRTKVFRKLVSFMQADNILGRVFKEDSWYTWDGRNDAAVQLSSGAMPAIRLTPVGKAGVPQTPVRQTSPFGVAIELAVNSFNMDDLLNLWGAVELAIFPGDGSNALLTAMQIVYPEVYDITLDTPAITPKTDATNASFLYAVGTLTVQMLIRK